MFLQKTYPYFEADLVRRGVNDFVLTWFMKLSLLKLWYQGINSPLGFICLVHILNKGG